MDGRIVVINAVRKGYVISFVRGVLLLCAVVRRCVRTRVVSWIHRRALPSHASKDSKSWDYAATLLVRRFVCYYREEDGEATEDAPSMGRRALLDRIRVGPTSTRECAVPRDQTIVAYNTAVTYVARDDDLIVHSERPDGRTLTVLALTRDNIHDNDNHRREKKRTRRWWMTRHVSSSSMKTFDFDVFAKGWTTMDLQVDISVGGLIPK